MVLKSEGALLHERFFSKVEGPKERRCRKCAYATMAACQRRLKAVRALISALLLAFTIPASAADFDTPASSPPAYRLEERVQIPTRLASNGTVRYAGALAMRGMLPLFQVVPIGGGGGAIVSGSTLISGGGNTQVCFNDSGTLACGDTGLTFNKTTDALSVGGTLAVTGLISAAPAMGVWFAAGPDYPVFQYRTQNTPDVLKVALDTVSRSIHFITGGAEATDLNNGRAGTAANANASLLLFSNDSVATEYTQITTDTTGAGHVQNNFAEMTVGGTKLNFTEGSAQVVARFTMPSGGVFGALVSYTVSDSDGTDHVGRNGSIQIQGANKSGTAVCTILATRDQETEDGSQIVNAAGAFTLTYTWTVVVNTTSCDLSINSASSAGANTNDITWSAIVTGNSASITVTPIP